MLASDQGLTGVMRSGGLRRDLGTEDSKNWGAGLGSSGPQGFRAREDLGGLWAEGLRAPRPGIEHIRTRKLGVSGMEPPRTRR